MGIHKDSLNVAQPIIKTGYMQSGGLSVAQPSGEYENVYGEKSELCKNCIVCGKMCVVEGESTNCTECVYECASSANLKTELPRAGPCLELNI